jgi:hypothetical protein
VESTRTPSLDHIEFDRLCADLDDFEPLPAVRRLAPDGERESEDAASLNEQILAGLVSPL